MTKRIFTFALVAVLAFGACDDVAPTAPLPSRAEDPAFVAQPTTGPDFPDVVPALRTFGIEPRAVGAAMADEAEPMEPLDWQDAGLGATLFHAGGQYWSSLDYASIEPDSLMYLTFGVADEDSVPFRVTHPRHGTLMLGAIPRQSFPVRTSTGYEYHVYDGVFSRGTWVRLSLLPDAQRDGWRVEMRRRVLVQGSIRNVNEYWEPLARRCERLDAGGSR